MILFRKALRIDNSMSLLSSSLSNRNTFIRLSLTLLIINSKCFTELRTFLSYSDLSSNFFGSYSLDSSTNFFKFCSLKD